MKVSENQQVKESSDVYSTGGEVETTNKTDDKVQKVVGAQVREMQPSAPEFKYPKEFFSQILTEDNAIAENPEICRKAYVSEILQHLPFWGNLPLPEKDIRSLDFNYTATLSSNNNVRRFYLKNISCNYTQNWLLSVAILTEKSSLRKSPSFLISFSR